MTISSIRIGHEELARISLLLNIPLPGLGDQPFGDASIQQQSMILAAGEHSLLARGWLAAGADNELLVEPDLADMVREAGAASRIIGMIQQAWGAGDQASFFYAKPPRIIEHQRADQGVHVLSRLDGLEALQLRLVGAIPSSDGWANADASAVIAETALLAARNAAREGGDSARTLSHAGVDEAVAARLASTLAAPLTNTTLFAIGPAIVHAFPDGFPELTFLTDEHELWMIRSLRESPGVREIEISGVDHITASGQIVDWLRMAFAATSHNSG